MTNKLIKKVTNKKHNKSITKEITRVIYVMDESGSMGYLKNDVLSFFKSNISTLFSSARDLNQYVEAGSLTFGDIVRSRNYLTTSEDTIKNAMSSYNPQGWTALNDAIYEAITILEVPAYVNQRVANLVVIITDGLENMSKNVTTHAVAKLIREKQKLGNWTFAFNGPRGSKATISKLYEIPQENIIEWEGQQEFRTAGQINDFATVNYMTTRSLGGTQTMSYYVDLNNITPSVVKKLNDVSPKFHRYEVKSATNIKDFVEDQGRTYIAGNAFYELTKPEDIQGYKNMLVFEKKTGSIYSGTEAKAALGLPLNSNIRVRPLDHSDKYSIFVESKSYNRKLVPGTVVLYKNNLI